MRFGPRIRRYIVTHGRLLVYGGGSVLISLWTVLRFLSQRTIFDLVGQQVLTHQWLHGSFGTANIGTTNYVLKMLVLYAPVDVLPGSPRLKLALLTIVINVASFVLLGILLEKLLREFGVQTRVAIHNQLLWLAGIAGSAFWIQFANSRNLEIVGGVFLLYESFRYLHLPTTRRLIGISAFTSLLLFADTLQLYMTIAPLLVYAGLMAWRKKYTLSAVLRLAAGLLVSYIASLLFFVIASHALRLHFLAAPNHTGLSVAFVKNGLIGSVKAFVHLYAGGADAGKLREACNLLFLAGSFGAALYAVWHRVAPRRLLLFVACVFIVNESVYILSGQAGQADTERYIVMTIPALLLFLASAEKTWLRFRPFVFSATTLLVIVNVLALGHATIHADKNFSQDNHLASVGAFLTQYPNIVAYSSMDTALPMAYLNGSDTKAPLPLSCGNGNKLAKNQLFYTETAFAQHESRKGQVAIILDGDSIANTPNVCTKNTIIAQLGAPLAVGVTTDNSSVLLYPTNTKNLLHY